MCQDIRHGYLVSYLVEEEVSRTARKAADRNSQELAVKR